MCVGGEGPDERKNNGTPGSLTRVFRLGKSDQVDRSNSSLLAGKGTTEPQGQFSAMEGESAILEGFFSFPPHSTSGSAATYAVFVSLGTPDKTSVLSFISKKIYSYLVFIMSGETLLIWGRGCQEGGHGTEPSTNSLAFFSFLLCSFYPPPS